MREKIAWMLPTDLVDMILGIRVRRKLNNKIDRLLPLFMLLSIFGVNSAILWPFYGCIFNFRPQIVKEWKIYRLSISVIPIELMSNAHYFQLKKQEAIAIVSLPQAFF